MDKASQWLCRAQFWSVSGLTEVQNHTIVARLLPQPPRGWNQLICVSVLQSPSWLLTSSWQVLGASSLQAWGTEAQHSAAARARWSLGGGERLRCADLRGAGTVAVLRGWLGSQ